MNIHYNYNGKSLCEVKTNNTYYLHEVNCKECLTKFHKEVDCPGCLYCVVEKARPQIEEIKKLVEKLKNEEINAAKKNSD